MTMHVKDAGTWKQVASLHVKDAGTWKAVVAGYVKDAGAWKQFYAQAGGGGGGGGRTVSLSPNPADGFTQLDNYNSQGFVTITITATPTGFTSPVYSWTRVSGPSGQGAFGATGTSTAAVTISDTVPVFVDWQETWRCTVSEAADPAISVSADVVVTLRCENMS